MQRADSSGGEELRARAEDLDEWDEEQDSDGLSGFDEHWGENGGGVSTLKWQLTAAVLKFDSNEMICSQNLWWNLTGLTERMNGLSQLKRKRWTCNKIEGTLRLSIKCSFSELLLHLTKAATACFTVMSIIIIILWSQYCLKKQIQVKRYINILNVWSQEKLVFLSLLPYSPQPSLGKHNDDTAKSVLQYLKHQLLF